jgi:hypothetical protein
MKHNWKITFRNGAHSILEDKTLEEAIAAAMQLCLDGGLGKSDYLLQRQLGN